MGFVENELGTSDWSMAWDCGTWSSALVAECGGAQLSGPKSERGWLVRKNKDGNAWSTLHVHNVHNKTHSLL